MIAEQIQSQQQLQQQQQQQQQQGNSFSPTAKYYQFSMILEHVIDCFHTIVSDETNPYHPPLAWLTRKQPKPPDDELFLDLHEECANSSINQTTAAAILTNGDSLQLSASVRSRLEKCPQQLRQEIVSRTRGECSPLFMACKNGLTRVVKYLLDVCGADIEQRGRFETSEDHHVHFVTPLWVAAVSGHYDTVKLLIDRKANVNSISDTGSTPIRSVCFLCKDDDGVEEYVNLLGEDDYVFGDFAEDSQREDVYFKIVHLLANNGADLSKSNYNGGTCLINSLHNYRLTNYIIDQGADVDASDNQSKTALHYAIHTNRVNVAKLLLARGANPFLQTDNCDDALQICCISGCDDIFEYLIENYSYSAKRLADAYKLLGSTILEVHYDLPRVRRLWSKALDILPLTRNEPTKIFGSAMKEELCDRRRQKAFGDMVEFCSAAALQTLTVDGFRIQSLLISERILGATHRETIQRLLYRGSFYINSLQPDRCLDLWIYAFKLRLNMRDSIFHVETIFSVQAIIKLFLDLFTQHQQLQVRFEDVHDVLLLLVERLDECEAHLDQRPRSCLHEDIYDLSITMIVNLLLIMQCVRRNLEDFSRAQKIIQRLVDKSPCTTKGSTLLHICVLPNMFEGEIHRSLQMVSHTNLDIQHQQLQQHRSPSTSSERVHRRIHRITGDEMNYTVETTTRLPTAPPLATLIQDLLDAGLEVDRINGAGLSAFQVLCLANSIRVTDKRRIIGLLVERGAHIDRRAVTPDQDEQIRQTLRECGVRPLEFMTLKCLAARRVSEMRLEQGTGKGRDGEIMTSNLESAIAIH